MLVAADIGADSKLARSRPDVDGLGSIGRGDLLLGPAGLAHRPHLGHAGEVGDEDQVFAVSNSGGLGTHGCTGRTPPQIAELADAIRAKTERPFGMNLLLFLSDDALVEAVLSTHPAVLSTAWSWPDFDFARLFERA